MSRNKPSKTFEEGTLRFEFFAGVVVVAGVLLFRWLSPPPEQKLVIAVADENGSALRAAAREFTNDKRHHSIEVQVDERAYDDLHDAVFDSVKNPNQSSGPCLLDQQKARYDVVMVDDPWVTPLRDCLSPQTVKKSDNLPESVLQSIRCGPQHDASCVIGKPYVGNSELFVINRHWLPDAKWPRDWNDVLELVSKSPAPFAYALRGKFDDESSVTDEFMPVFWAFSQNGHTRFEAAAAAARTLQLLGDYSPPSIGVYNSYDVSALLLYGKLAMGLTWSDWAMQMADANQEVVRKDLEFGLPPGGKPELGMWLLGIPKNAPHPREAAEFVRAATEREALKKAALAGNPPVREDLFDDPELTKRFPTLKVQRASLEAAQERPAKQKWHECSEKEIGDALRGLYFGKEELTRAATEISEALGEKCP